MVKVHLIMQHNACIRASQYWKAFCSCCNGKCYIDQTRNNECNECRGKGSLDSSDKPVHIASQYRRKECDSCHGERYTE